MGYRVIVAHPGKQHSFRLASALKQEGMLLKYVTTVYNKRSSTLFKLISKVVSTDNLKRIEGRRNPDLEDDDVIQYCRLRGYIAILLARYDKSRKIYAWWQKKITDKFGRKVARLAIKENADAVVLYNSNALVCFEILKKKAPQITRIMDVSAAYKPYIKKIYERDFLLSPEFAHMLKREKAFLWKKNMCLRFEQETKNTQYFLTPSTFVIKSLLYGGIKEKQMALCPYGANFESAEPKYCKRSDTRLKIIYVGIVAALKGIHYLLEAVMQIPESEVDLTVVGAYDNNEHSLDKYKRRVNFTGAVLHEKVKELLLQADVFVFPSLGDGFGLAILEALSCGLPCIVSENCGGNDAITDYENGFVIPPQDVGAIKEKILWFYEHPERLHDMSEAAIKTAKKYTWEAYNRKAVDAVKSFLE